MISFSTFEVFSKFMEQNPKIEYDTGIHDTLLSDEETIKLQIYAQQILDVGITKHPPPFTSFKGQTEKHFDALYLLSQTWCRNSKKLLVNVHQQGGVRQITCVSAAGVEAVAHSIRYYKQPIHPAYGKYCANFDFSSEFAFAQDSAARNSTVPGINCGNLGSRGSSLARRSVVSNVIEGCVLCADRTDDSAFFCCCCLFDLASCDPFDVPDALG
uniref:Uncharacterized protein n=1 Tax=Panagrolaimus davidi TaxID=227884 RepID=A0A914QXV0_9BILA